MTQLVLFAILVLGAFAQYDFTAGKRNCMLSYAAYCGTNVDSHWSCYWCSQVPGARWIGNFGVTSDSVFGYVVIVGGDVYVVWRGTDNLPGWIRDGDFKQVPYSGAPSGVVVHQGFFSAVKAYHPTVRALVKKAFAGCPGCRNLFVTGHSLGGALATISALQFRETDSQYTVNLYTFGQPRVGNQAFASWANSKLSNGVHWRMTNERDPVPHLPLKAMNYYHITREIWRSTNSSYIVCNAGNGEDPTCIDKVILQNPFDHGLYMGVDLLAGIPHGCLWIDP